MTSRATSLVFIHPSDELYGADRMLLEQVAALPDGVVAQVWLPTDVAHSAQPLCAELRRRGIAVRHTDIPVLRRAYRTPLALARIGMRAVRLFRRLRAAAPDTVYCTTSAAFLAAPVARAAGVGNVLGHVQEIWTDFDRRILSVCARACGRLLAISNAVAERLPRRLQSRTVVVPNGTPDVDEFISLTSRAGPLTFVVASRWNGWKGHGTLLAAWDAVGEGALVILGGPPGTGETTDVYGLVAALRRPGSVTIVGEVRDPDPYLSAADVVVVPSDRPEPFGLVAIEAFARGRPVVASAAGGLLDIVSDGVDGWLFAPGDAHALATLLRKLSREEVTTAGQAARASFEARFTSERYAAAWRAAAAVDEWPSARR